VEELALFVVFLHCFALLFYVPLADFNNVHGLVPLFLQNSFIFSTIGASTFFCKTYFHFQIYSPLEDGKYILQMG